MASPLKEAYPFSGLSTLSRENYQAWIANLDCPITDKQISSAEMDATLSFNCTPNYLPETAKWFTAFNLANSHTSNQDGLSGFQSTRNYLDQYKIQYFGHYDKNVQNEICEIISVPAKATLTEQDYSGLSDTNYKYSEFYIPIAICGFHDTFSLPTSEQLDEISKYSDKFITLVYAIQGAEYNTTADGLQMQYYRAMIDRGADAVIGKGAHVVQNTESYKGKLIVYSMGNFIFDQQDSPTVRQGISVGVDLKLAYGDNLERWQSIASSCKIFADDCLKQATDLGLTKPKYTVNYNITALDNSGKLAKKASDEVQHQMLIRTNWQKTASSLEAGN